MKMSFCGVRKECCGFSELRGEKDKIVWSRDESFEYDRYEIILGFLNDNWDFHFVMTSHEN